ncbi:MAG: helix-turn-helix domain-containing protein [Myxococcales bacterium]|nr:helix-turn-helix domain-containing protein [Myxococcales bacterium]
MRIGRNAMYAVVARGEVPHQRIGKLIRISRRSLMRWLVDGHRR